MISISIKDTFKQIFNISRGSHFTKQISPVQTTHLKHFVDSKDVYLHPLALAQFFKSKPVKQWAFTQTFQQTKVDITL